ncbi:P-loop containing nucleoside triphosphate hydrolase protein [Xylariomycetidae sp. FL0641]|nr:P-loop containing nucleoside triphosphate hydrolase protein [Xylariomycetidae sp. FL0641]
MGQEASKPRPGTTIRVIGAGLPRTGTASLSAALELLLDAPVYHGGTQISKGGSEHMATWTALLLAAAGTDEDDDEKGAFVLRNLERVLDGYAAVTDISAALFVPELVRLYPEALVVATVRDPAAWARSVARTARAVADVVRHPVALLPLVHLRGFPAFARAAARRWRQRYPDPGAEAAWHRHLDHLRRTVPPARLVFVDVRDGWQPLCDALGVAVPEGVEFPRVNDGQAMVAFAREQVNMGLRRWAVLLGAVAAAVAVAVGAWRGWYTW